MTLASLRRHARFWLVQSALAFALVVAAGLPLASAPAHAQSAQPSSPGAADDAALLQYLQTHPGDVQGRVTIPDAKSGLLIQPQGRDWREFHEVTLRWIGAIAILGVLALLVIFYLWRGMIRIEGGRSGRTIVRFNFAERLVHWLTATCFIILAISGLNITFGKPLLLPLIGYEAFSTWSLWAKYAHNFLSFPFTLGVVLIFFMWLAGNIPNRVDVEWLKRGGGFLGHDKPPAERFNAGQKLIYWIVVLGGTAVAVSGYVLIFPFYGTTMDDMQTAQIFHGIVAMLFIAAMLGHIYIGTIGMEGAFEAMGNGTVDLNWAKEHHSLWVAELEERGAEAPRAAPRPGPAE